LIKDCFSCICEMFCVASGNINIKKRKMNNNYIHHKYIIIINASGITFKKLCDKNLLRCVQYLKPLIHLFLL